MLSTLLFQDSPFVLFFANNQGLGDAVGPF